jgi:hypothetical protein
MALDNLRERWDGVAQRFRERFGDGEDLDVSTMVYLIGIQELGAHHKKLNKNQKMDVMHVGVCTLLERYGYYAFQGRDEDGWPHFEALEALPALSPGQQQILLKEAIVLYIEDMDLDAEGASERT